MRAVILAIVRQKESCQLFNGILTGSRSPVALPALKISAVL
jgi:hypothetical protein